MSTIAKADSPREKSLSTRVTHDEDDRLRWLAFQRRTTPATIIYEYIRKGMASENFEGYAAPPSDGS